MCDGQCDEKGLNINNVINLYKHFFPYRSIDRDKFGDLSDWGVSNFSASDKMYVISA